jgi:hypothetical protein
MPVDNAVYDEHKDTLSYVVPGGTMLAYSQALLDLSGRLVFLGRVER